jgi:hypothetical protein
MEYLTKNKKILKFFKVSERRAFRKVVLLSDKEGKTREVAIADYWTQTVLKPLHIYLANILKNIKADCTHNQSKLVMSLKAKPGSSYHSIDLSSATDRFPIEIQKVLIRTLANRSYAESWYNLMVNYPFDSCKGELIYRTGNPMGVYSSFTAFALSHHFFVWLACHRSNIKYKNCPYMLLGDDIVIADDKVAGEYKQLLVEWDIPFSPDKTYTSLYGFEFAKQIRYKEINISPLSLSSFYNNRNNYTLCISFLVEEIKNKSWNVESGVWIKAYLRGIQKFSARRYKKVLPSINLSLSILEFLQGRRIDIGPEFTQIVSLYYTSPVLSNPLHTLVLFNEVIRSMLKKEQQTRMKSSSNIFNISKNRSNKNNLKIFSLMKIIGMDRGLETNKCFQALPFISYYNEDVISPIIRSLNEEKVEPNLLDRFNPQLMRSIYSVDTRPINLSDYYARGREVLYRTSWSIAESLKEECSEADKIKLFGKSNHFKLVPV